MAAKTETDKIEYEVVSVNQYTDANDMVTVGDISRPKRKVSVQLAPVKDEVSGVFAFMDIDAQAQRYKASVPSTIDMVFTETEGPFPWGVGDRIQLSKK